MPKLSPETFKIKTKSYQNEAQNLPKSNPNPPKIEPKLRQEDVGTAKKPKKNIDPVSEGVGYGLLTPFWRKKWPTWLQVGLQNRANIALKTMQKSIEKLMHLGIDFLKDFDGFLERK